MNVGDIVIETVDGTLELTGVLQSVTGARAKNGVKAAKGIPSLIGVSDCANAFTNEAVPEVVNETSPNLSQLGRRR